MGQKIYVCTGAVLKCTYGTSTSKLSATYKSVTLCGEDQANIADHISLVNIKPFGRCKTVAYPATGAATAANHGKLTPMPCVPGTTTNWSAEDKNSVLCGQPALLDSASLKCIWGGKITIKDPGQQLEKTGAEEIKIVTREATISCYYWENENGEQCDMDSNDNIDNHTLCLVTNLSEGDQLIVDIGGKGYNTVVGSGGVAKVENVSAFEIDWDIPMRKTGNVSSSSSDSVSKKKAAKANPVDTGTVNTTKIDKKKDTEWGDPLANPTIRGNSANNLYGYVRRDSRGRKRCHQGFDYYAAEGTSVMSVGDGIVERVEKGNPNYGNNLTIRHQYNGKYIYSFYAHLKDFSSGIHKGKAVKKGEVIAHSGTTGNAKGMTGADQHLHFEMRTRVSHELGLGGKDDPNNIVATKFKSANPNADNQSNVKVVKG